MGDRGLSTVVLKSLNDDGTSTEQLVNATSGKMEGLAPST